MATSRDVQEIISKISSDKAKDRDEEIKLLNNWLEGERSVSFCRLLGENTVRIKAIEIPHAEIFLVVIHYFLECIMGKKGAYVLQLRHGLFSLHR